MASQKDAILGKLAVERGFLTQKCLDEAFDTQRKMLAELGLDQPLEQVLMGKHWLTADQAHELRHAAAVETGEARLVAGYEVVSKLGQGGMGAVYKARRIGTPDFVALKILPPSLANEAMIARFRRESEIVRKLHHDNIVGCVEFGYDKRRKCHFCALELVEGEDLWKRIERVGKLSEDEALSITTQITSALQHAYYNDLVHRDVKPDNIMVTPDGTAKLLDLGLARPASREVTRLTESQMVLGSPYYISPEQAKAEQEVDIRSDIYSLGATLYHMVTGKPPFEGTTPIAILQKHVTEKLPWPGEANPDLSDGLCRIIAKMMEKAPEDRYETPNDLHRDLDLLAEGKEPEVDDAAFKNSSVKVPAVRPRRRRRPLARARAARERDRKHRGPAERDGHEARAAHKEPESVREHRREAGRGPGKRLPIAGVAAGVLAGVAIAVVLATRRPGPPSEGADEPVARGGGGGGERETPRDPGAPVKTEARRRLDEIKAMIDPALERYAEVRTALLEFADDFDDPACLKEAKGLLAKIDADFGAAADQALEKAAKSARGLAADGKFDEAKKALGDIRERFGESGWFETSGKEAIAEASAKIDAAHSGAAKALVARARAAFDSGKFAEARAALEPRDSWPEGLRARADDLLTEIDEAEGKLKAEEKAKGAWAAFLLGFPDAGKLSLAKARAFLGQERKAFEKLGAGEEIAKKLAGIERRFREARLVEELAEVGFRGARRTIYLNWKGAKVGGKIQGVEKGVLRLVTTRGRHVSMPIAEIAGADVVRYSRIMRQGSREKLRAAAYLFLRGDPAAAREASKDVMGDAAWALGDQIDEFVKAVEAREARKEAEAEATRAAAEAARAAAGAKAAAKADEKRKAEEAKRRAEAAVRGLVGHWKFDERKGRAARDSSGRRNHGAVTGGRWTAKGKLDGALYFDGNDWVDCGDRADFRITGQLTLSAWVNVDPAAGKMMVISKKSGWNAGSGYELEVWPAGRRIAFLSSGGEPYGKGERITWSSGWHHAAVTADGRTAKLYFDGRNVTIQSVIGPLVANRNALTLGRRPGGSSPLTGLVDDVRVYRRAFSSDEIKALFEGPRPAPEAVPTKGLVAHWRLDEPARSTRADDATGNGNHGTPVVGARSGSAGRIGGAWCFDGNDYIAVPDTVINPLQGTISGWVKLNRLTKDWQDLFGTGSSPCRYYLNVSTTGLAMGRIRDPSFGMRNISIGEWHHLAVTWVRNGAGIFYLDGTETGSVANVGNTTAPKGSCIGAMGSQTNNDNLNGLIDDVRVYDRELSAEEVKALFENRASTPRPAPVAVASEGPVAHWEFDEGWGTVAKDATGMGSDATVKGARWTAGKLGGALEFDGTSAGVDCPVPTGLTLAEATVAFWASVPSAGWKPWRDWWELGTAKGGIVGELAGRNEAAAAGTPALYKTAGVVPGATYLQHRTPCLPGTGWRHIAYTMSASANEVKLHVDGALVKSNTWFAREAVRSISLGYAKRRGGNHVRSTIDDVRIYSRALSAEEIRALAAGK